MKKATTENAAAKNGKNGRNAESAKSISVEIRRLRTNVRGGTIDDFSQCCGSSLTHTMVNG